MQINLKEAEIATAIKRYLTVQGINLTGKSVAVKFTATRSGAGVIADIAVDEIEDSIPGFETAGEEDKSEGKPTLGLVPSAPPAVIQPEDSEPSKAPVEKTVKEIAAAARDAELPPEPEAEVEVLVPEASAKTTSLFA